ncbi:hypothetical protein, partial [Pseudomonas syringae group genomosp. 3]|uniref:hypothetical protein n=1 Tax=Pseudomonas syringae group genomosp. 3 TaxID=251701 RepID=UPI001E3A4369
MQFLQPGEASCVLFIEGFTTIVRSPSEITQENHRWRAAVRGWRVVFFAAIGRESAAGRN